MYLSILMRLSHILNKNLTSGTNHLQVTAYLRYTCSWRAWNRQVTLKSPEKSVSHQGMSRDIRVLTEFREFTV